MCFEVWSILNLDMFEGVDLFRLRQIDLTPQTTQLNTRDNPDDDTELIISFSKEGMPKLDELEFDIDSLRDLRRYHKWRKGKKDCKFKQHRYPVNPATNYRKPHTLCPAEIRYMTGSDNTVVFIQVPAKVSLVFIEIQLSAFKGEVF